MFAKFLTKPNAMKLAREELYQAEIKLLEAQTALEWAKSNVEYQQHRITRLKKYVEQSQPTIM